MSYRHKKHFGQHFLNDKVLIDQLISYINPKADDLMLEIGPGGGALTVPLLETVDKLYAVEVDKDCVARLSRKYPADKLALINQDVLQFSLQTIEPNSLVRVVGNLPYNISTPLLFHLYQQNDLIDDLHVMVQYEVAARICAEPDSKQYGRLSVMSQYYCEPTWLCDIGPESFDPPPKVDSAFIRLQPKHDRDVSIEKTLADVVAAAFNQRRKTISNSLKQYLASDDFEALNIDKKSRAENLSLQDYIHIAKVVIDKQEV